MKKSRYTEEQIAFALKQAKTDTSVAEVIRRMGISEQTFYRWKKVYGGLGVGELQRLKLLEENRKLKQLVADLSLDKHILQDVWAKSPDAWATTRTRRARPVVPRRQRATQLLGAGCRSYLRDDRRWRPSDKPAALFRYSPDRKGERPREHLKTFSGFLQADAYAGFEQLYDPDRKPGPIMPVACWAHPINRLDGLLPWNWSAPAQA